MEKLSEYLQTLLSTCSYELHLEPNKTPFMTDSTGTTEVANTPLLGTQISTIVFPLIPPAVKQKLPNQDEVEFVHNHHLGNFNFTVRKSPAGFNVTIRPLFGDEKAESSSINEVMSTSESNFQPNVSISTNVPTPTERFADKSQFLDNEPAESFTPEAEAADKMAEKLAFNTDSFEENSASATAFTNNPAFNTPFQPHKYSAPDESAEKPKIELIDDFSAYDDGSFDVGNYDSKVSIDDYMTAQTSSTNMKGSQMQQRMDALFRRMAEFGASDLHMSVSVPPMVRKDGKMMKLDCSEGELTPGVMKELLSSIMPAKNLEEFEVRHDTDFAYEIVGLARFRANVFADRKGMGGVFRIIPSEILTAEQLGLSKAIMDLCDLSKGLVVVTGPTGSGKSTTLCAMVDSINRSREDHIITIEDPIEFTHENQKCLVNQREVHNHTDSFKNALRAALREDPDILLVGEMRDLETISIAIETAETGHLVFGTLHTTTAASTVDRIIDQFPADRQQQVRVMLSESLRGVIAQTLLPKKGGGRIAALEILIVTPAISNLIREGKTFQIPSSMQTGKNLGMVMLNDALMELVKKDLVEPRDAYIKAVDKPGFESLLKREGLRI